MLRKFTILTLAACLFLAGAPAGTVQADETTDYTKIRELLGESKFDEAEKLYEAALEKYPGSSRLESLGYLFYLYADRDEKHDAALKHIERHVDRMLAKIADNPQLAAVFSSYVDVLLEAYGKAGRADDAGPKLDAIIGVVQKAADGNVDLSLAARDLKNKQITRLAESDNQQAQQLLDKRLADAKQAVADKPDSSTARLDRLYVLKAESELARALDDKADEAREKFLTELLEAAKQNKSDSTLAAAAVDNYLRAASMLSWNDAYAAEKLLTGIQEFAASLDSGNDVIAGRLDKIEQAAASMEDAIATGKRHADLIGKDAVPLAAEAWVNGSPLTAEQLEGKVVLIDFWAVWCGPCIAAFPHLREWQEEYADKGLVIIGATKYYDFDWNEETERSERSADLSDEQEQQALLKFAEHHELKHRFMVAPEDGKFSEAYGVGPIPQVVLIDRAGKIRLIRVGAGEETARDIEKELERLIEDK